MGDESPRYRYSHSQAIVLTVETHTALTEIALLYSTQQSNAVYNTYMQYYITYIVILVYIQGDGICLEQLDKPTGSCYIGFASGAGAK